MGLRDSARMRGYEERIRRAAGFERVAWFRHLPVRTHVVLYESFAGNGMLCNPEAIFRALLVADEFAHLHHVWVLTDLDAYASTVAEFADNPRVRFVRYGSADYHRTLATAKYLVNNATFSPMFAKRDEQIYLNTWHGTPLKAMGYDMPGGAVEARNVLRNFVSADYLLAPNEATASMYLDAYRARNVFRGALVCEGTPRVDRQFASSAEQAATRARLRDGGTAIPDGRQIVLYAPTWKGDFQSPSNDIRQLRARVDELRALLDPDRFCVLLKVHQQVYRYAVADAALRPMLVGNEVPTNETLGLADVLITDYSSIYIDYLASGRPVLFLAPDLDDYAADRGLNFPPDEWPGPVCRSVGDLAARIAATGTGGPLDPAVTHAALYATARERYCPGEDGKATERLIDVVFGGHEDGYDVRRDVRDGRPTVLIYLGGVLPNGITMSALSLLDSIDHSRVDVSVFYVHTVRPDRAALIDQIDPRVRLFPRIGGMLAHKHQVRLLKVGSRKRPERWSHATDVERYSAPLRDEWRRCFGDAHFDHVVDFSGYSPLWVKILLQSQAGSFSMWQHNDLVADAERMVGGRYPHRDNLNAIFDLYRYADHLVSVSGALADVNRAGLAAYAPPEKFTSARNTIGYRRILHRAFGLDEDHPAMTDATARPNPGEQVRPSDLGPRRMFHPADLRGSIELLGRSHSPEAIAEEANRRATIHAIAPPAPGVKTFVTVGRLSPEKNHARLIRAFDLVHQQHPDTRLVILGSGPLDVMLDQLVTDLGLGSAVTLAGHQPNPYGVMAQSDCFVLSSDYEGQPMVILEALVLGLPVVTTSFASVRDAFPDGCGLIVDSDVAPLAEGMRAVVRGEVEFAPFDYVAYNEDATREFYRAIGLPDTESTVTMEPMP